MKEREISDEYNYHVKRLARIMSGHYLKQIPSVTQLGGRKSTSSYKIKTRETCGEYQRRWNILKENQRLVQRITKVAGVINFKKGDQDLRKHLRGRRARSNTRNRISNQRQIHIVDIVWKNTKRNFREQFSIKNLNSGISLCGTIDQIKKKILRLEQNDPGHFEVQGQSKKGKITVYKQNGLPIFPITNNKKHLGDVVISTNFL